MRNSIALLIMLLWFTVTLDAQHYEKQQYFYRNPSKKMQIDKCKYLVTYSYKFITDTINKISFYDIQALEIGYKISHYYSVYAEKIDSVWHDAKENKPHKENKDGIDGINSYKEAGLPDNADAQYDDFYMNYPNDGLMMVSTMFNETEYIYEEPVAKFNWKFTLDTTTIIGYKCICAKTTFRGRTYNVWFSLCLPLRHGPWKFSGLPGLILKVSDINGYFEWLAINFEKTQDRRIYINKLEQANVQKSTREKVMKLKHKRWQDPVGLVFANMPSLKYYVRIDKTTNKPIYYKSGDLQLPYIPIPELE